MGKQAILSYINYIGKFVIMFIDFYKSIKRNPIINELGWGHTDKILNVEIPREFDWKEVPKDPQALYIGFENEIPEDEARVLDRVYYHNGKIAYVIAKL